MARVPLHGRANGFVDIEPKATIGAMVGRDLLWPDGTVVTAAQLRAVSQPPGTGQAETYWRLIMEVPLNVVALAETESTGLYVVTGAGTSATRAIEVETGDLTVENGDAVMGNPRLGLAEVPDQGGGQLQRTAFDAKGRRIGTSDATTDDLEEGARNQYHTAERAVQAVLDAGGVFASRAPIDGEILEFDAEREEWSPTLFPRKFFVDGGNF